MQAILYAPPIRVRTEAAKDRGKISEEEILRTVGTYRREKRVPEITVASEN